MKTKKSQKVIDKNNRDNKENENDNNRSYVFEHEKKSS